MVVRFVESICHRPSARLDIILGISPPGRINPFAELNAIYSHILSSVDDIQLTLHVLRPLEDVRLALINLSSVLTYYESSGTVDILHASLVDILSDKRRSTIFYIDMASVCSEIFHQIFQYVEPDGPKRASGDSTIHSSFCGMFSRLSPWILKGRLRSDILTSGVDAFINASTGDTTWNVLYQSL